MMGDAERIYGDIIDLERPVSERHPRMKREDRAAQFSPFAALTGYEDAVAETARVTEERITLSEEEKILINEKLSLALESESRREVTVRYFIPDKKKDGGRYENAVGRIKCVDGIQGILIMEDGRNIPLSEVCSVE